MKRDVRGENSKACQKSAVYSVPKYTGKVAEARQIRNGPDKFNVPPSMSIQGHTASARKNWWPEDIPNGTRPSQSVCIWSVTIFRRNTGGPWSAYCDWAWCTQRRENKGLSMRICRPKRTVDIRKKRNRNVFLPAIAYAISALAGLYSAWVGHCFWHPRGDWATPKVFSKRRRVPSLDFTAPTISRLL